MTAQINAVAFPTPGVNGMAKSNSQTVTGPDWCIKAENCIIDAEGRLAARKGWEQLNTNPLTSTPDVSQVFEYLKGDQSTALITAAGNKLWSGTTTPTAITGTATVTVGDNWQFVNFNGKLLGFQQGEQPIVWTGTGNFADLVASSGTAPNGNCAVAAFGRVWACDDDRQTIQYSALLDETKWATADGAGLIDMRKIWTQGMDEVVGITSYGSQLVVFGRQHIVFWTDGAGSELGMEPSQIYVNSIIENVGLVARDAFVRMGELDIIFWSFNGIRTLRRTIQELATPVNEVSSRNRDYFAEYLDTGSLSAVRMVYSAVEGFVLLLHPTASKTWCFDVRYPLPDGSLRTFEWTVLPTAAVSRRDETLIFGFADGLLGTYTGYQDDGASYRYVYHGGWFPLSPETGLKMLKRAKVSVASRVDVVGSFKWWTDFKNNMQGIQRTWEPPGGSLYNHLPDQFNYTALYSGGGGVIDKNLPLRKSCQYMRFGFECVIDGSPFALQFVNILFEPTRYA